jgi:hypothetical protein
MTPEDAIAIGRAYADSKDWAWLGSGIAHRRGWLFRNLLRFGKVTWFVVAHDCLGTNVKVEIDDESGQVIRAYYLPR